MKNQAHRRTTMPTTKHDDDEVCSICGALICGNPDSPQWAGGSRNAFPVNDGRCCAQCDRDVVLPARIKGEMSALRSMRRSGT